MEILDIRVMRGPNYWSIRRHKLIVMKLDIGKFEELPSNKIPGFAERMEKMFPSMYEHHCSEGVPGGFFSRVREGTWMGHVVEHIALEMQTLAGMDCGFGRTRSTGQHGVYNVVFNYMEEKVGVFAAKAAVRVVEALAAAKEYDLAEDIQRMREIREDERLGPSTGSIVEEAIKRKIPWIRLNKHSLVQLGYGINQRRIQATVASTTSSIAVEIACDKEETKNLLEAASVPVPRGRVVYDEEDLEIAVKRIGYPIVVKPVGGNHGRGATINVNDWESAVEALANAKRISRGVIVEKFITGFDHRLLVIDYKFVAAAVRTPAMVTGDGKHSIRELVDIVNSDTRRGYGHEKVLTAIKIDEMTLNILEEKGMTEESVPPKGEIVYLKRTANLSTGGTSTDVTDIVHPYNVFMAERIARIIGLDICGIDIMTPDIRLPMHENGGAVLEVNAGPGFRMHIAPAEGLPRNVAEPVIDMLYPPGSTARIPIIAVTGTNGKTTTTRLIAHLVKTMGHKVGFTTTDGIYIQNRMVEQGDCTGPVSAEFVLKDPTVDFAVLECARGGILKAGLGFHNCDIGIVTNVAADHLGLKDINTLEDMARVKGVIPESVLPEGFAILNADDDLVYDMRKNLKCKIALFSLDENNPRILKHSENGGISAIVENGYITICKGSWKIRVDKVVNIPLTFSGKAVFMIQNILPAVLAGFVSGFKVEDMRLGLETFIPSPTQTPGRMNMFHFRNFDVMVDYAHNPAGFQALARFHDRLDAKPKVGIIAGVGDRRDEDIVQLGSLAAQMFDEIIIRQDKNLRGRTEQEIIDLMMKGIQAENPSKVVRVIPKESEAIEFAIRNAKKGSFITICSDVIPDALEQIMKYKEEEDHFKIDKEDIPQTVTT
ncbi:MAG: cyanophycin synthetase [Bacteroidetes bacterium]|nr:MAG: cyanophycin synthetase [Bacteroidota bacterium]REK07671.1 MAG: cyanophycin synthetase [Bacteroidota bacterium]REK33729.1 MAG: cyanophycin synthetase [Bacteroidota bacterium]REK49199.1 MAG: cyanophycin synthetase [Bacteroidota bacterium]